MKLLYGILVFIPFFIHHLEQYWCTSCYCSCGLGGENQLWTHFFSHPAGHYTATIPTTMGEEKNRESCVLSNTVHCSLATVNNVIVYMLNADSNKTSWTNHIQLSLGPSSCRRSWLAIIFIAWPVGPKMVNMLYAGLCWQLGGRPHESQLDWSRAGNLLGTSAALCWVVCYVLALLYTWRHCHAHCPRLQICVSWV